MENYNYTCNTVLKFLRKVLNEINKSYIDSGMRTAFLMKRYIEKYNNDNELGPQHVLLCMLKDIGLFYMDGEVPSDNPALAAASSYTFLEHCSPLGIAARPLLFYKAKYIETQSNLDYDLGLLMTILNQVSLYIYQRYKIEDIETVLKTDRKRGLLKPEQVKRVIKLLNDEPDIIEKLNSESNLYVYETSRYISSQNYSDDILEEYIDTTSFAFEFHNHETLAHTVTTAQIAYDLALKCRLTKETAEIIKIAGKVHDIGKIRVPREILCYPGRLEGEMLQEMQMHATYTKEIIEGSFSYKIVEIAARHHEKLDGSGYPNHLTDSELSSADKVLAVADICSALYCKRSYKEAFDDETIKEILLSDARNGKLDKRIVEHLVDSFDEIMENAKKEEAVVLQKYNNMKEEYEALSKSSALSHFFDYDEYEEEPEPEEEVIYVDEEGNEISPEEIVNDNEEIISEEGNEETTDVEEIEEIVSEEGNEETTDVEEIEETVSEEVESEENIEEESIAVESTESEVDNSDEEDEFEKYINSLEETETKEEETVELTESEEETNEEDEFEKYINSLEEESSTASLKSEEKTFKKPIRLTPNIDDFDPFAEPEEIEEAIDPFSSVDNKEEIMDNNDITEDSEDLVDIEESEENIGEEIDTKESLEETESEEEEMEESAESAKEANEEDEFEFYVPEIHNENEINEPSSEENDSLNQEEIEEPFAKPEVEEEFQEQEESLDEDDEDEDDDDLDEEDDDEDEDDEEDGDDESQPEEPVKKFFDNNNNKMKYMGYSKKFNKKFKKKSKRR